MCTSLSAPALWAREHFGLAQLGDRRLNERLIGVAARLAAHPAGTLPSAFPVWCELKAAYRFFDNHAVNFENVIGPHLERSRQQCRAPGEYLILEDTTLLDYSGQAVSPQLGAIGNGEGRGFELHSALAVRVEGWTPEQRPQGALVGLVGQRCEQPRPRRKGEKEAERWQRPRKSRRWAAALQQMGRPPAGCGWTYVADREADFYEPLESCQAHGIDCVIRARHDRRLAQEGGHLYERLAGAALAGRGTVEVRARGGEAARSAMVEVRTVRVDLDGPWRVGGWREPLKGINVVEVREVGAAAPVKQPLHWILLTTLACDSWQELQRVVGRYAARWWIEEYHKALKSGAGAEQSQLESPQRLEGLVAVLAVVAVRLLSTKLLARSRPEGGEALESFSPEALQILEKKFGRPKAGWDNQSLLLATARLGGFLARKGDGLPGWQTIWRGWQRLMWMSEGVEILKEG